MKVIGESVASNRNRLPEPLASLVETLKYDREWLKDTHAQDIVVSALNKLLNDHYVLIRNATLEGLELPIPLILVGPPGVWVLYPSALRGIFRANGTEWEVMNDRRQDYVPARTNFITRASLIGAAVESYLKEHGYSQYKIDPVIIFTDPGTHVESINPSVRIVLMDGLDRFVTGLMKSALVISWKESQILASLLSKVSLNEESESLEPIRDAFSFIEERDRPHFPEVSIPLPPDEKVVKALKRVPFTNRQLFLLGCLIVINILLLVGFVILILFLS